MGHCALGGATALSAQQDYAAAFSRSVVYGGWFSGEALSSDVNASGNLWATRRVDRTLEGVLVTLMGLMTAEDYSGQGTGDVQVRVSA